MSTKTLGVQANHSGQYNKGTSGPKFDGSHY